MMPTQRMLFAAMLLVIPGTMASAQTGSVVTVAGRKEGPVALQPGAVRVGNETIPWSNVMLVVSDAPAAAKGPHAVRLSNGDILVGKIAGVAQGTVTLESAAFGVRKFETTKVAALDLVAGLGPLGDEKKNSLYRGEGSPISGKLLWLKEDRLAIDAPIGAVELKLTGLKRYVFNPAPAGGVADEAQLVDGSVVRGVLQPTAEGLTLENDILGKHTLPPTSWSSVRRYSGNAVYLADLSPTVETRPLIVRPADPPRAEFNPRAVDGVFSRMTIMPHTIMRYRLPGNGAEAYILSGTVRVRGTAVLELRSDGATKRKETILLAGAKPFPLLLEVSGGDVLEMDFRLSDPIRFPCVVTLENALLQKK